MAPGNELRKWFGHDPSRWEEFRRRYFAELEAKQEIIAGLLAEASKGRLTLLYSARDEEYNQAVVLGEYLISRPGKRSS